MSPDNVDSLRNHWWLFQALGAALILVGIFAMISLYIAAIGIQIITAWALILGGIIYGLYSFNAKKEGGSLYSTLIAIAFVAAGVILLARPAAGLRFITLVLGVAFLIEGIFSIYFSWKLRRFWNWGWGLLNGAVSLILGITLLSRWNELSGILIGLIVGIDLIFAGWALIVFGSQVKEPRPQPSPRPARGHA